MGMRVNAQSPDYLPFANQMAASEVNPLERLANRIHLTRITAMYPGYGPVPTNWHIIRGCHIHTGINMNVFVIRPPTGFRFVGRPHLIYDSGYREQFVPNLVEARVEVIGISTDLYEQNGIERGIAFRVDCDIVPDISP